MDSLSFLCRSSNASNPPGGTTGPISSGSPGLVNLMPLCHIPGEFKPLRPIEVPEMPPGRVARYPSSSRRRPGTPTARWFISCASTSQPHATFALVPGVFCWGWLSAERPGSRLRRLPELVDKLPELEHDAGGAEQELRALAGSHGPPDRHMIRVPIPAPIPWPKIRYELHI